MGSCPSWKEDDLQEWLSAKWKTKFPWRIRRLYGGDFLVGCPNNQWRTELLDEKGGSGVEWKPWTRSTAAWPVREGERKWIELIGVPLDLWEKRTFEDIVSKFGKVVEVHPETANGQCLEAARIRIELGENAVIPKKVKLAAQKDSFWIGIHETRIKSGKKIWVRKNKVGEEEATNTKGGNISRRGSSEEGVFKLNIRREESKTTVELEEERQGEVESISDPFNLWEIIGEKPQRNKQLWEEMGRLVADEFQALAISQGQWEDNLEGEHKEKANRAVVDEGTAATEGFMSQLRATEGQEVGDITAQQEVELYSPSTHGGGWNGDTWSREEVIKRGQDMGLQVSINTEKMLEAWTGKRGGANSI